MFQLFKPLTTKQRHLLIVKIPVTKFHSFLGQQWQNYPSNIDRPYFSGSAKHFFPSGKLEAQPCYFFFSLKFRKISYF